MTIAAAPASTPATVRHVPGSGAVSAVYPAYAARIRRTAAARSDGNGLRRRLTATAFRTGSVVAAPHL